jgi:hypothetical protein
MACTLPPFSQILGGQTTAYVRMSTHDLLAIYTYLSAIPHAENTNAPPAD